jgi:hypothetical protein
LVSRRRGVFVPAGSYQPGELRNSKSSPVRLGAILVSHCNRGKLGVLVDLDFRDVLRFDRCQSPAKGEGFELP